MLPEGGYDLAGFAAGLVEESRALDGSAIREGDVVVGLASSGLHANGFSLVRRILERAGASAIVEAAGDDGTSLVRRLLEPTRIYVRPVLDLLARAEVHGLAHVTGGGLLRALGRLLPAGFGVELKASDWPRSSLFDGLAKAGDVAFDEMARTFNLGLGMCVVAPPSEALNVIDVAASHGIEAWSVGTVAAATGNARVVVLP
jgi:phosphoribosylformylglycinamidine cyclo-ligase